MQFFDALCLYEYYDYSKIILFSVCIISYYDVHKPIIFMFSVFFCHYDCSLLKILPSFPELVCNYKFCSNNNKKKIRGTGAQTPHSTVPSTTLPSTVFLHVYNVCTKETYW